MTGDSSLTAIALVALGGAVGAVLRHLVDQGVSRHVSGDYPWGVLLVNAIGSLLLGWLTPLLAAGRLSASVMLLLGMGLCGALTTYSTVAAQTWGFIEQRRWRRAVVVITATVVVSLAAALAGQMLAVAVLSRG